MRDSLTGLYSRRSLDHWIDSELVHEKECLTVVMIDLDRFKIINDTMGHNAGDAILISFGSIVKTILRTEDIAIRYGGDEFLLVLRNSNETVAQAVMNRLEEALQSFSFRGLVVSVSWGLSTLVPPATRQDFEQAVHSADAAMYRMKKNSRQEV